MHWAVRNDLFLFVNANSWLPYSTVGWLVFNVNKRHFLQAVSLEEYSIFARKIIKKLSNSEPLISIFIIIYIFIKKIKTNSACVSLTITTSFGRYDQVISSRSHSTRAVPVNRGLYKYIKNLMSQNNKTFHIYQILYYTHNK